MKSRIINSFLFIALITLLSSCEKETIATADVPDSNIDLMTALKNDDYRKQIFEKLETIIPENQRGADKIVPLIPSYGLILFMTDENGNMEDLAFFDVTLGPNDSWTQLPDGSMNIHINNNSAYAAYYNPNTGEDYCGENGHLSMNFNGIYTEITLCFPFGCFELKYIDTTQTTHAYAFHGRADVGVTDPITYLCGTPDSDLTAHFVRNNGGQANGFIKLK